jgi:hypothetical protein
MSARAVQILLRNAHYLVEALLHGVFQPPD